jgi:cytidine deaminase
MFEFAENARVWLVNDRGVARAWTVGELLPGGFRL